VILNCENFSNIKFRAVQISQKSALQCFYTGNWVPSRLLRESTSAFLTGATALPHMRRGSWIEVVTERGSPPYVRVYVRTCVCVNVRTCLFNCSWIQGVTERGSPPYTRIRRVTYVTHVVLAVGFESSLPQNAARCRIYKCAVSRMNMHCVTYEQDMPWPESIRTVYLQW